MFLVDKRLPALEMDSSDSSDALLMNIFCRPRLNGSNAPDLATFHQITSGHGQLGGGSTTLLPTLTYSSALTALGAHIAGTRASRVRENCLILRCAF